jgi:hypothetical protein
MMNGDNDDPGSVEVLRDILAAAESAYDPDGNWDVLWADVVDPRTGAYRHDVLSMLSDPMAQRIIGVIHDGFLADDDSRMIDWFDFSNERLSGIMRELEEDRDRITRILSALEYERMKLQKW